MKNFSRLIYAAKLQKQHVITNFQKNNTLPFITQKNPQNPQPSQTFYTPNYRIPAFTPI